jgi:hypothetical protein
LGPAQETEHTHSTVSTHCHNRLFQGHDYYTKPADNCIHKCTVFLQESSQQEPGWVLCRACKTWHWRHAHGSLLVGLLQMWPAGRGHCCPRADMLSQRLCQHRMKRPTTAPPMGAVMLHSTCTCLSFTPSTPKRPLSVTPQHSLCVSFLPVDADVGTAVDVGGGRAHVTEPPGFLAPVQV